MNRWLVLRIIILSAAMGWAIWSIQDTDIDLLADNPLELTAPGPIDPALPGDALVAMESYQQALLATERCGKGSLKVVIGEKGLAQASWLGSGEPACLQKAVWSVRWPALPSAMELGN